MEIHSFRVDIATKYGIAEAILLGYFYHWIKVHEKNETNFYDGKYWTFDTVRGLVEKMPYFTRSTVHRAIKKLEENKLILTGNFNKISYDKTTWYTLTDDGMLLFGPCPKMRQGLSQNGTTIPIQSTYSLNRERDKGKPAAENFPGSKYSDEVYDKARSAYERFIGPIPNSGIKEGILSCVDDYGLDDFINVVKLAARNNAYSFAYIETVLRNQTKRKEGDKNGKNKKSDTTKAGRPKVSQYI